MAHVLASAVTMHSHHGCSLPRKVLEFAESLLARITEVGKGFGTPAPKLVEKWTHAVWHGKSDITDEHRSEQMAGSCSPAVKEQRWSEENLRETTEAQDDAGRAS